MKNFIFKQIKQITPKTISLESQQLKDFYSKFLSFLVDIYEITVIEANSK